MKILLGLLIALGATIGGLFGFESVNQNINNQVSLIKEDVNELRTYVFEGQNKLLGASTQLFAGFAYTLSGSGISSSATSVTVTSLTLPQNDYEIQDSDLSETFYITFEPGNQDRQEIVSCTTLAQSGSDNTATLSGCTRGLSPITPYTASSTLQFAHGGGTKLIFSDPPQVFQQYTDKDNEETITRTWTFDADDPPKLDATGKTATSSAQLITKEYADALVIAGAADMTGSVKGIGEQAHALAAASSTTSGGTSAPQALTTLISSAGCTVATSTVVVTKTSGRISKNCISTSTPYDFYGANLGGATSTPSKNSSIVIEQDSNRPPLYVGDTGTSTPQFSINPKGEVRAQGARVKPNFGGDGSDGALVVSNSTTTIDLASAAFVTKQYKLISLTGTGGLEFSNAYASGTVMFLKSSGDCIISSNIVAQFGSTGGAGTANGKRHDDWADFNPFATSTAETLNWYFGHGAANSSAGSNATVIYGGFAPIHPSPFYANPYYGVSFVVPGAGGGGGGAGNMAGTSGGTGGTGGGGLVIECAGTLTFTGYIHANGVSGSDGTAADANKSGNGGGGGGAGGMVLFGYNSIGINTGAIRVNGGRGGNGSNSNGTGNFNGGSGGGGGEIGR